MKSIYWLGLLGVASLQVFSINPCLAQTNHIVPDNSLGAESSGVVPLDYAGLNVDVIDGGAIRGGNLFHSFAEFNVVELRGAYFLNPSSDIQNILARVTGNNPSEILGTLGIFNGVGVTSNPDLYLINPNGIIFGENASLDVGGSFVGTTANGINLGETGLFSARELEKSSLLTVEPSALFFNAVNNQAEIINRSQATSTVLGFAVNGNRNRPINGLQVLDGKSLLLVGGNVTLDGGTLFAPGGRVELGSIAGIGSVSFNQTEKGLVLGYENVNNFGDIKLSRFAFVDVSGESGGNIQIQGKQLLLEIVSTIVNGTNNLVNSGGEIFIRTTDSVIVDNSIIGFVSTENSGSTGNINIETKKLDITGGFFPVGGFISTITVGERRAGDINIKAETVSLRNGGEISASTNAGGDAGNITINASESVEVIGSNKSDFSLFEEVLGNIPDTFLSKIASDVNFASGKAGNILINTKRLFVKDGGQIQAGTFGTGKGGTLTIIAPESVEISGTNGAGSPSGLFTATFGGAEAGDLTINTGKLRILNGGTVSASTAGLLGEGKGGNLIINATDSVEVNSFSTEDEDGTFFSSIVAETGRLLRTNTGINPALGGNLTINTGKLNISNGGRVSSTSYALDDLGGKAGNLTINAGESIEVVGDRSFIAAGTSSTGDAGDLRIRTQKLTIREGAEVSTTTSSGSRTPLIIRNRGQGGILDVDASEFVEVSGVDSGLVSFSLLSTGDAGSIKLNTSRLFINDGATVSTSSFGRGRGGDLEVSASDFIEISGSGTSFISDLDFARTVGLEQVTSGSSLSTLTRSTKDAGNINVNTRRLFVRDGGEIIANTLGTGKGGDVSIQVDSAFLENNASISSSSGREQSNPDTIFGNAGDILIDVRDNLLANNSTISTTASSSSGGAIDITAKNIHLFDNSNIRTDVANGEGGGGNITLTANTIVALDDSDIFSFARDGKGGDISFNTAGFFSTPLYRPTSPISDRQILDSLNSNSQVDVNASGAVSGAITGVPDITFIENSLSDLQQNPIDTNALIANSCIARSRKQESTFNITGAGGLPQRPGDAAASNYPTGEVQNLSNKIQSSQWKPGEVILEPQGVYELPSGQLILSRECS